MLEELIRSATTNGCRSITLVRDPQRGWQASVQKGDIATFSVHISANPIDALTVALGGLRAAEKPVQKPELKKTYWYHPESDCVWSHIGEFPPEMEPSADLALSTEITEEQYHEFLAMQAAEKAKASTIIDPELDDLL